MKQLLILTFLLLGLNALAQNELTNIYLSKSEMAGGTESSGVTTTLAYTFVSRKALKMSNITFEEEPLLLKAKDTLIIYFITNRPYGGKQMGDRNLHGEYEDKKSFAAYQYKGYYGLSVNTELEFTRAATYRYKKKKYIAKRKTAIDSEQRHFAP